MNSAAARIHLLTARAAPVVVVIRRKPSDLFHIVRWDTQTDRLQQGSWFQGRLYPLRCDVSFNGEYMIYQAMGVKQDFWTGLCRVPVLRSLGDFRDGGVRGGGGVFSEEKTLDLHGLEAVKMHKSMQEKGTWVPFTVKGFPELFNSVEETVIEARFKRDGFVKKDDGANRIWTLKPSSAHPILRARPKGFDSVIKEFQWDLPDHPNLLDDQVNWAAYDALGQLVYAREGVLYRYTLEAIRDGTPTSVLDLEGLTRPDRNSPAESVPADPIQIVEGRVEEQKVATLILPWGQARWADQVRKLAGGAVSADLDADPPELGHPVVTLAYYLRQHHLVHIVAPGPGEGFPSLLTANREAFRVAGEVGVSVALRPIGIEQGWTLEDAMSATQQAAEEFVSADAGRQVVIVKPA